MRFRNMEIFRLEDRVLFEAAAAVEVVEAAEAAADNPNANVSESDRQAQDDRDALKNAPPENPADQIGQNPGKTPDDPAELADVDAQVDKLIQGDLPVMAGDDVSGLIDGAPGAGDDHDGNLTEALIMPTDESFSTGRELVVVNGTVPDLDAVITDLKPNQDLLVLDDGSGLSQLNEYLDAHEVKYDAIHLVTHGDDGVLSVNGTIFKADKFDASGWQDVGEHLTDDGDILLYGCDIAASAEGRALVEMIADASGADVAASDDATGVSGDWDLEYSIGDVETAALSVTDYQHDLAVVTITVDTLLDDDDPTTTSLRDAITSASTNGGEYLIEFDVSGTITLDPVLGAMTVSNESGNTLSLTIDGGDEIVIDGGAQTSLIDIVDVYSDDADINLNIQNLTMTDALNDLGTGGAIRYSGLKDIAFSCTLDNVTITNSTAVYGGGIGLFGNNISLALINSTIYGNTASEDPSGGSDGGDGGGIYVKSDDLVINVINSTITGNCSKDATYGGGGIFVGVQNPTSPITPRINVLNSILYGNYAGTDASDLYISDAGSLDCNVVYSVYGVIVNTAQLVPLSNTEGSVKPGVTPEAMQNIFASVIKKDGLTIAEITDNHHVLLNNQGQAAYSGTQVASVGGRYCYLAGETWKYSNGTTATTPDVSAIITVDQNGGSRTTVLDQLGIAEFAIGAVVPAEIYLQIVPEDQSFVYDGQLHTSEVFHYYTASGAEVTNPVATLTATAENTASKNVGTYDVTVTSALVTYAGTDVSALYGFDFGTGTITITPKTITIDGLTANDKVYDGTTEATFDTGSVVLDGMISGGDLDLNVTGEFEDKNVGTDKIVTVDLVLSGDDAGNYVVDMSGLDLRADITPKTITIDGLAANDKVYDGTTDATLNTDRVTFGGMVSGDELDIAAVAAFEDKNVGTDKLIVLSDLKLTGADGANYQFDPAQVTIYADITARNVTLIAASDSKVYDGTPLTNNSYSIGGDGFVAGEGVDTVVVTGSQTRPGASENVITSYTLAQNTEAGNYEITLQSGVLTVYASGYGFVNYDQFPDIMNWNFSAVVPAMLGSALASGNAVVFPEGNLYAAPYSTLVAATETSRSSGGVFSVLDELRNGFGDQGDKFVSSRYQPGEFVMELDQLVRDVGDSVIGSAGKVSNAKALGTGNELFVDDLSVVLEISGNSSSWALAPVIVQVPDDCFETLSPDPDGMAIDDLAGLGIQFEPLEKLDMFKSDLELILDEMSEA